MSRRWCEGGDFLGGQGAREDTDLVDVSDEIARDVTDLGKRGRPHRSNGIRRVLGDEHAIYVELGQAGAEHAGCVVPCPIVVCERGRDFSVYIGGDGLIEYDGEPSIILNSELP